VSPLAVLVADDEPGMRDTLAAILEHHGYRVALAADGELWITRDGGSTWSLVLFTE